MKTISEKLVDYYKEKSIIQNLETHPCSKCGKQILEPYDTCLECENEITMQEMFDSIEKQ